MNILIDGNVSILVKEADIEILLTSTPDKFRGLVKRLIAAYGKFWVGTYEKISYVVTESDERIPLNWVLLWKFKRVTRSKAIEILEENGCTEKVKYIKSLYNGKYIQ